MTHKFIIRSLTFILLKTSGVRQFSNISAIKSKKKETSYDEGRFTSGNISHWSIKSPYGATPDSFDKN